ncbi:MAG: hypothetical protein U9P49_07065 [Thermodesulfobacteriota bacterium]|nr:hypothetical protein [Thermodesulfobacteriota bacterium]
MANTINKGIIDAINRILRELLKKPVCKNTIRSVLNSIDPESARDLVKTLIWQDPELVLSLMGAAPSIINTIIKALDEVGLQIENFPPDLIQNFARAIVQDIDKETMERALSNLSKIINNLSPIFSELLDGKEPMKGE